MAWISYAQNAEDVLLMRAFGEQTSGFYIDVGAHDPMIDSVTKAFYDRGWRGINVEPVPDSHRRVSADRPRDINLRVGCSDRQGRATFFEAVGQGTGLSTFSESDVARHEKEGFKFRPIEVPIMTLANICAAYVMEQTVDFLKIDVEGHEAAVLSGADFSRFRPRLVLIEATRPNSRVETHGEWEDLLIRQDYQFFVFDGLNRWYVRAEDRHLAENLLVMPNIFDDYVPYRYQRVIDTLEAQPTRRLRRQALRAMRAAKHPQRAAGIAMTRLRQIKTPK